MGKKLESAVAVLNGVVGDYLSRRGNSLATEMVFIHEQRPLPIEPAALRRAYPSAGKRLVILVHGLMNTETAWAFANGDDYGQLLARDFGDTAMYLRYNTGLPIADNGATLSALLDSVVAAYPTPLEELIFIGYSMGGLVIRSACHTASGSPISWLPLVKRAIYVGTPHLGAPIERVGRVIAKVLGAIENPYTQLISELANLRSDGIKDLGDADLRHQDRDPGRLSLRDARHPVPLLPQMQHYLLASTLSQEPWLAALFGDSIVPLGSATNGACVNAETMAMPPSHIKILPNIAHIDLSRRPEIYQQIQAWCAPETT
jgi:triacylglycerol lipase